MSRFLTAILRQQVSVTPGKPQPYHIPEAQQSRLGASSLGVDMLLGDAFSDGIRTLQVCIGQVPPAEVAHWLPGGSQRRLLEEQLFPYVLPAGEQVHITIGITGAECRFVLNDDDQALNILGYTTIIA
jgi:predicted component of type VI protein secretion system